MAAERLRARLTQPLAIGTIASREPLDEPSLDYLMPSLSYDGYAHAARRAGLIAEPHHAPQAARSPRPDVARRRGARRLASRRRPLVRAAQHAAAARADGPGAGGLLDDALDHARRSPHPLRGAAIADGAARPARAGPAHRVQRRRPAGRARRGGERAARLPAAGARFRRRPRAGRASARGSAAAGGAGARQLARARGARRAGRDRRRRQERLRPSEAGGQEHRDAGGAAGAGRRRGARTRGPQPLLAAASTSPDDDIRDAIR